jgi:hypothetical protein
MQRNNRKRKKSSQPPDTDKVEIITSQTPKPMHTAMQEPQLVSAKLRDLLASTLAPHEGKKETNSQTLKPVPMSSQRNRSRKVRQEVTEVPR